MSSSNTSNIGSNSADISSSAPSNMLLRDLVPPRRRLRTNRANNSDLNMNPALEDSQPVLQPTPWAEIVSTVKLQMHKIKEKFFIPSNYEIVIPRSSDRMHRPPPGFCSFSLQHFEAGLRFSLPPSVALILRRLNLCPMQLSPNSIRHIILFIIIMRVHRFEPNFENFWSLYSFTTSVRSGDNGFFYLTSRKECRFLDPLTSNVGPWKSNFIFVRPPPGREWPFSLDWKVDKPTPLTEGEGLDGDQISSITTYRYNPKKILVEEILWLAHLTPAPLQVEGTLVSMVSQARINKRLRAQIQARSQAQATMQIASSQPVLAASSTPDADTAPCPIPIEVGSEETQPRSLLPPNHPTIQSHSWRLQERALDDGDFAESSRKRKSRGKSPLRPNLMGTTQSQSGGGGLPSEGTGSETMRNMDVLRGLTDYWRTARSDFRGPDHPVAHMEGDKWIPDWQISPHSSVFRTRSGQDSWELYDASCLPLDQAALLQTSFTRMEEHCAHSLVQAANFVRGLSLKCAGFRHNQMAADRTIRDLRAQLATFFSKEEEWSRSRSTQEARIKELEAQVVSKASKAAADGEKRGFEAGHAAGKIVGVSEGCEIFLKSEEFTQQVRGIRLQGVRDFLKTPTFDSAVEIKAADYLLQGFDRCKSQISHLQGFAPNFDISRLNPSLDVDLRPLPEEDDTPSTENDEFSVLLDEIENL
ncbi:UNVERIFIED_CONTAM: hypothetical protein Sindi_0757100 [Sesamum indicum]